MKQADWYLGTVWGTVPGFPCFAVQYGGQYDHGIYTFPGGWREAWAYWPKSEASRRAFVERLVSAGETADVFAAPLLFSERSRRQGFGIPGSHLFTDVDWDVSDEELLVFACRGRSFWVRSGSSGHAHLYVEVDCSGLTPAEFEELNHRLAAALGADSKWSQTTVLRVPGTFNHKDRAAGTGELTQPVVLQRPVSEGPPWTLTELEELLRGEGLIGRASGGVHKEQNDRPIPEPLPQLPPELARMCAEEVGQDRSLQTFELVLRAIEAGLSQGQALTLAGQHAPSTAKYGLSLADEVARISAEHAHRGLSCISAGCARGGTLSRIPVQEQQHLDSYQSAITAYGWPGRSGRSMRAIVLAHLQIARLEGGRFYMASQRQIAEIANVSRDTVRRLHGPLRDMGWLERIDTAREGDEPTSWTIPDARTDLVRPSTHSSLNIGGPTTSAVRDVFAHRGLGKAGDSVYRSLSLDDPQTAKQIAEDALVHPDTCRRKLKTMASHALAYRTDDGRWLRLEPDDWEQIARDLRVLGTQDRRRDLHKKHRRQFLAGFRRPPTL